MGHALDRLENIFRAFVEMKKKREWYSIQILKDLRWKLCIYK